jgi:hypothetical protein
MKHNKKVKETASAGAVSAGAMATAGAGSLFGGKKKKPAKTKENTSGLSPLLIKRISENLVRVDDIVNDRKVYGTITSNEKNAIKNLVHESSINGLDYEDAILSVTEYLKQFNTLVVEANVIGPTASTSANSNVATGTTTTSTTQKPINQQVIDEIAQMVKNAGLNPSQLNQVMSKARTK